MVNIPTTKDKTPEKTEEIDQDKNLVERLISPDPFKWGWLTEEQKNMPTEEFVSEYQRSRKPSKKSSTFSVILIKEENNLKK